MAFSRAAALRCSRIRPTTSRPQLLQRVARRCYASGGHETAKKSDAPWAAGAVAVTIPACWYLMSGSKDTSHGNGEHAEHHGEAHEEKEQTSGEESKGEGEKQESEEEGGKESDSGESGEAGSDGEDQKGDSPGNSGDESRIKGVDEQNVRKHIPDANGGAKARVESKSGIKQGVAPETTEGEVDSKKDVAATSKPPGSFNAQSGKQEGISNTDAQTSIDLESHTDKSKKAEGHTETAKEKGTVDPNRPAK